jgi:hypothetical protein
MKLVSRQWSVVSETVFKLCTLRHALCLLGAVLIALCSSVQAQQTGRVYRLGFLSPASTPEPSIPTTSTLVPKLLRDSGYVEGRNLHVSAVSRTANSIGFPNWPKTWSICAWT